MYCARCGKESPEGSQQCVNCGAQLVEAGGYYSQMPPGYGASVKTSGLAIAALILGICSIFCGCLLGIPALIMGIVALGKIDKSGGAIQGKGLATGAIVTAAIGIVFSMLILPALLFPVFARARETARKATCVSNLHECGVAIQIYCGDYDGMLPCSAGRDQQGFITGVPSPGATNVDMSLPPSGVRTSWGQVICDYLKNRDCLLCPSDSQIDGHSPGSGGAGGLSYYWKTAADMACAAPGSPCRKASDFAYIADQVILYERSGFHTGEACLRDGVEVNVCFLDSHIRTVVLKNTTNSSAEVYPMPADVVAPNANGEPAYYNYDFANSAPDTVTGAYMDPRTWGDRF